MRISKLAPNVLGVDTVAKLNRMQCRQLVQTGYKFRGGYLDEIDALELESQLAEGLPLVLYTYALELDPAHSLSRLSALNVPPGACVVADLEGCKPAEGQDVEEYVQAKISQLNAWGKALTNHAYLPCLYYSAGGLLTSHEITQLAVYRYHAGASQLRDRLNGIVEPLRGYSMFQGRPCDVELPSVPGAIFDVDFHRQDFHGDVFTAIVGD